MARRRGGARAGSRLVARGARHALALIASAALALAQSETSWRARVDAASDPEALAALVEELERAATTAGTASDASFVDARALATYRAILELVRDPADGADRLRRVERARAAARRVGDPEARLRVENDFAWLLLGAGDVEGARGVLETASLELPLAEQNLVATEELLGAVEMAACRWSAALERFRAGLDRSALALERARARGADDVAGWLEAQRGYLRRDAVHAYLALGLPDLAWRELRAAEADLAELSESSPARVDVLVQTCDAREALHHAVSDFDAAFEALETLVPDPAAVPPVELARLRFKQGVARADQLVYAGTRGDEALALLRTGIEQGELPASSRATAELAIADVRLARGELDAARAHVALARAALAELPAAGCERAFLAVRVEALAAEVELRAGAGRSTLLARRDALDAAIDATSATWEREAARAGGVGFLHFDAYREPLIAAMTLDEALEPGPAGAERALARLLRAQRVATLARRVGAGATSPADVLALLAHDDARAAIAIAYVPGARRSVVLLVEPEGAALLPLPPLGALDRAAGAVAEALAPPPAGETGERRAARIASIRARCAELAPLLLPAPVARALERSRGAYVAGLELAGNPPFELLPLGASDVGRERAIARLPSLAIGVAIARAPHRATAGLVLSAAPRASASAAARFARLATPWSFDARAERDLRDACGGHAVRIDAGELATYERFEAACASGARVAAILTHGVRDPDRELAAGLAFAPSRADDDGLAWAERIAAGGACAPYVALLACGAGRGPTRLGDDAASQLGGVLLARGARTVLLSKHDVAEEPMFALLERWAPRVLDGRTSPAEALRRARDELARRPGGDDPYVHGLVVALGLGLEPAPSDDAADRGAPESTTTSTTLSPVALVVVLAALAAALALVARRRRRARAP